MGVEFWLPTPEAVEAAANQMRAQARPPEPSRGDQQIKTPDDIIYELEVVEHELNMAVRMVRDADKQRANAKAVLRRAVAKAQFAQKANGGTAAEKSARVVEAVEDEQVAVDVADVTYRFAKSTADWLEGRKSSLQTQAKLVMATLQLAGSNRHER